MQNARKPRVRQKNQKTHKPQKSRKSQKKPNQRNQQKNHGDQQTRQIPQTPQTPQVQPSRPPQPRSEPYGTEAYGSEAYGTEEPRRPHSYPAVTGTARSHFPSRPAARLAGLTDRAGRLADHFTPRTTAERVLDLTLGTALLILTAPAVAVTALALTARHTPGGAWDRRPRTGLGGRVFELRTLRTRRFRLDVLSRLPHVVRGELALVGPAPLPPGDPRAAGPGARQWRQEMRPGLTGLAQVRARSGMPWDDPALLDQHYAEHHGVVLDLAILTEAVRDCLRTALPKARRTKAHLSDTDHRPSGYSGVD
ncbi:sugar transferase [Streptomyces sp. NPDC091289]|uniref:sugar transferase n=1 Tax=Streptomyces sp. NPDC091289 TaxID=3365989 RepID=UPI0038115491